jgi:hypothetical protein
MEKEFSPPMETMGTLASLVTATLCPRSNSNPEPEVRHVKQLVHPFFTPETNSVLGVTYLSLFQL